MKIFFRILTLSLFVVSFCSCSVTKVSQRTRTINDRVISASAADLEISTKKVTYTMNPPKAYQRGGIDNVIQAVVNEALKNVDSDADVLVGLQYVYTKSITGKIKSITVSGYPAKYKNFRPVQDESIAFSVCAGNPVVINKKTK